MRQRSAVVCAAVVSCGLGMILAGGMGAPDADEEPASPLESVPVALQRLWFQPVSEYDTEGEPLDDERFGASMPSAPPVLLGVNSVLDEEGVIRHVNKRGGGLIAAVDELLMEKQMREYEARTEAAAEMEETGPEADGDGGPVAEAGTGGS